jgi:hypothetical protein
VHEDGLADSRGPGDLRTWIGHRWSERSRHDRFKGFTSDSTFIVLPEGATRPSDVPFLTRFSTDLGPADVHPFKEPRRTRPARSLVDAASWCESDRYTWTIVIAGMQQGLVNSSRMHEALDRRGTCRRAACPRVSVCGSRRYPEPSSSGSPGVR